MKNLMIVSVVCLLLFSNALATTYVVDQQGGGDFTSIQQAVNMAGNGDVIQVHSGVYYENVVFPNPAQTVYLRGDDPATTIIDAGGVDKCIRIVGGGQGEISGFTLQNSGYGYSNGILNCAIVLNTVGNGSWQVNHNIIRNHPEVGILNFDSGVTEYNLFENCNIGLFISSYSNLTVRNNTFVNCQHGISAHSQAHSFSAENNIFVNGWRAISSAVNGPVTLSCNCFWGYQVNYYGVSPGEGDFTADPMFCDPDYGDYSLFTTSPCAPGNDPNGGSCGLIGGFFASCGSVATTRETWDSIKAIYR